MEGRGSRARDSAGERTSARVEDTADARISPPLDRPPLPSRRSLLSLFVLWATVRFNLAPSRSIAFRFFSLEAFRLVYMISYRSSSFPKAGRASRPWDFFSFFNFLKMFLFCCLFF